MAQNDGDGVLLPSPFEILRTSCPMLFASNGGTSMQHSYAKHPSAQTSDLAL